MGNRTLVRCKDWPVTDDLEFMVIGPGDRPVASWEPIPAEIGYEISRGIWRLADVWADRIVWHEDDPTPQERLLAAAVQQELRERVEELRQSKPEKP